MRNLTITEVRIKNFRSIKEQTIAFPQSPGFRFLFGNNQVAPEMGANAAGKSTLWMAIHWCFYGVGPKGERTSVLTTWNEQSTEVEIRLRNGEQTCVIERSGPPNKLSIDSRWAEQSDIEHLLGLSKIRFQHSVVFAQGQRLFPDLSIPERGELLEDVLNLNHWAKCSDTASSELDAKNTEISISKQTIHRLEGELTGIGSEEAIQTKVALWEIEHKKTIDDLLDKINLWDISFLERRQELQHKHDDWAKAKQRDVDSLLNNLERAELAYNALPEAIDLVGLQNTVVTYRQQKSLLENYYSIAKDRMRGIQAEQSFWTMTTQCSACGQAITEEHRKEQSNKLDSEYKELDRANRLRQAELLSITSSLEYAAKQYDEANRTNEANRVHKQVLNGQIEFLETEIRKQLAEWESGGPFQSQIKALDTEGNPFYEMLKQAREIPNPYTQELDQFRVSQLRITESINNGKQTLNKLEQNAICIEYWKHGFKRLRLYLINRILSVLEIEINAAITSLGLIGWQLKLKTETETKSGTTRLGTQILIQAPRTSTFVPWESWSGGEGQRLRLGMALGVASLIQRSSGVDWSLEVYDEPTQYLSAEGIENLMEILNYRAQTNQKQIWICDHVAPVYSNFSEIWTAVKTPDQGTVITKLN